MRLVLLGGLSTLLAGLVALGGVLMADRRAKPSSHTVDELDEREPPSPPRPTTHMRRLPNLVSPPCTPKQGWACWRGRLRLPEPVRAAWAAARAADAAKARAEDVAMNRSNGGERDEIDGNQIEGSRETGDERGDESVGGEDRDEHAVIDLDSAPAGIGQTGALPPAASFVPFFAVRAVRWSDQPHQLIEERGTVEEHEEPTARLEPDGTFQLDVPPGTYDLEAIGNDDHLIAGMDGLVARPGDARGDLDVTLAAPAQLSGRVVGGDGVAELATVEVHRVHQDATTVALTTPVGRFVVDGLRPGSYVLVAANAGTPGEPIEVRAPLDGVELHVTRLPTAMLLVAPSNDGSGRCPTGGLILTDEAKRGERRGIPLQGCQALVPNVRPGSTWKVVGKAGDRSIDRVISFGSGKPIAPVCLDVACRSDEAAVDIRVVDAAGDLVDSADIEVLDGARGRWPEGAIMLPLTAGFRVGATVTLRATAESLQAVISVWLVTGVNDVVIRLPGRVSPAADSAMHAR